MGRPVSVAIPFHNLAPPPHSGILSYLSSLPRSFWEAFPPSPVQGTMEDKGERGVRVEGEALPSYDDIILYYDYPISRFTHFELLPVPTSKDNQRLSHKSVSVVCL